MENPAKEWRIAEKKCRILCVFHKILRQKNNNSCVSRRGGVYYIIIPSIRLA